LLSLVSLFKNYRFKLLLVEEFVDLIEPVESESRWADNQIYWVFVSSSLADETFIEDNS
jgi:hypothetical protein